MAGQPVLAAPSAPTWPVGSTITVTAITTTSADLSWTPAVDDVGVTGYNVYRDGNLTATPSVPSVSLSGLNPSTEYSIRIEALDGDGNETAPGTGPVFEPRVDLNAGGFAHSVKAVDVNSDGKRDLVVAVAGDDGVSILLGNGDGTFGSPSVYRSGVATGSHQVYPKNVVVVDVDGDTIVDLVTANQNSHTIGVLIGNGNGTFGSVAAYGACDFPHDVTVGQFNAK